jgi:transposase-like protein
MPEHRRKFRPQFKAEAVQMVILAGKPIAEMARDLGIDNGTLGSWVNAWRYEHPKPDQPPIPGGTCAREGTRRRGHTAEPEKPGSRMSLARQALKTGPLQAVPGARMFLLAVTAQRGPAGMGHRVPEPPVPGKGGEARPAITGSNRDWYALVR